MTATYELPLLAHACLEPLNCTVHVTPTSAEAWIGTQVLERVHAAVAKAADLPESQVTVHNHLIGGGFGRRLEPDMAYTAARIAKQVEGPVKVVWTREEDIRHDMYRPAYHDRLWARLDGDRIVAWKHRVSGSSVLARFFPPAFRNGVDPDGVDSAQDIQYDIPNLRVEFNREEPPGINTAFWRGVGPNNNVFAIESFVDELARKVRKDPIDFRRPHLNKTPRLRAALDLVREKSGWGSPLAAALRTRGLRADLLCELHRDRRRVRGGQDERSEAPPRDDRRRHRDSGEPGHHRRAAVGRSCLRADRRALWGNHARERSRSAIEFPRLPDAAHRPDPSDRHPCDQRAMQPPGGIGEAGTTAALPALRNAIYAATGVSLRRMPIDRKLLATS